MNDHHINHHQIHHHHQRFNRSMDCLHRRRSLAILGHAEPRWRAMLPSILFWSSLQSCPFLYCPLYPSRSPSRSVMFEPGNASHPPGIPLLIMSLAPVASRRLIDLPCDHLGKFILCYFTFVQQSIFTNKLSTSLTIIMLAFLLLRMLATSLNVVHRSAMRVGRQGKIKKKPRVYTNILHSHTMMH